MNLSSTASRVHCGVVVLPGRQRSLAFVASCFASAKGKDPRRNRQDHTRSCSIRKVFFSVTEKIFSPTGGIETLAPLVFPAIFPTSSLSFLHFFPSFVPWRSLISSSRVGSVGSPYASMDDYRVDPWLQRKVKKPVFPTTRPYA